MHPAIIIGTVNSFVVYVAMEQIAYHVPQNAFLVLGLFLTTNFYSLDSLPYVLRFLYL